MPETCLCATTEGYRCPLDGHAARWCAQHPMFDDQGVERADTPRIDGISAYDLREIFLRVVRRRRG